MKYRIPRIAIDEDMRKIIVREMRKQKDTNPKVSNKHLKEMVAVEQEIKKNGLPAHLVCVKLPHNLGHGIFLRPDAAPILKDQVIAPYAGVVTLVPQHTDDEGSYAFAPLEKMYLSQEEQRIHDKKNPFSPRRYYAVKIDALKDGNFTRFINHSDKPNVAAHIHSVPANIYGLTPVPLEVIYFAKKTIRPGEQLLVCYEDGEESYWKVSKIKPFPMTPRRFMIDSSLNILDQG